MKPEKENLLLTLFITMLRIGLFTFGGGYAMIALLEHEFVDKKHWIDKNEFLDMAAIAESTPGPIAINSATYLGYRMKGVTGSLVATVAICIPSFTIIYIISLFFDRFLALTVVSRAFRGIQVCVVYLILSAGLKVFSGLKKKPFPMVILALTVILMLAATLFAVRFSTVFYILGAGFLGLARYAFCTISAGKKMER